MYCNKCGSEVPNGAVFCQSCGCRIGAPINEEPTADCPEENPAEISESFGDSTAEEIQTGDCMMESRTKAAYKTENALLAALASFLVWGLGQLYIGKTKQGLVFLAADIICTAGIVYDATINYDLSLVLLGIALIVSAVLAYDAYKSTKEYNRILTETGQPPW